MATPLNTKVYIIWENIPGLVDALLEFLPGDPALMGTNHLARLFGSPDSHDEWMNRSIVISEPRLASLAAIIFLIRNNPNFSGVELFRVNQGPKKEQLNVFSGEWDKYLD